jgi:uncharacterized protein YbjT (DUF2867 family)
MSNILITGASGTVGSALVSALRSRGIAFQTMRSSPTEGAVSGNFADIQSLAEAFGGVETLFLLLPLTPDLPTFGHQAIAAAKAAGVRHVVRLSGAGADANSPFAIARVHGDIDLELMNSGMDWTLVKPNSFMQNHLNSNLAQIRSGYFYAAHGQASTSLVDARDIADALASILAAPAAHVGKSYTLTGGEALTDEQQMAAISAAAGRTVSYVDMPESAAREAMLNMGFPALIVDWLESLNAVVRAGYAADISSDVLTLTGRAPRRFADFALEHAAKWSE